MIFSIPQDASKEDHPTEILDFKSEHGVNQNGLNHGCGQPLIVSKTEHTQHLQTKETIFVDMGSRKLAAVTRVVEADTRDQPCCLRTPTPRR